jgi:ribulose-5-phosphate 4-epimerase/fuculose-1-phosphate aldolase
MSVREGEVLEAKRDLAAAFRWANRLDLNEGIDNHFSMMVPGSNQQFLINPYGRHWSQLKASHLIVVDGISGESAMDESFAAEKTAFHIHWSLHKMRADAKCVLHTHMPYATALCLIPNGRLEMAYQNALRFYGKIAYCDEYNGILFNAEQGDRLAASLGEDKRIIFHKHHGIIVVGRTIAEAFEDLYFLDRTCQLQWIAKTYAGTLDSLPEEKVAKIMREFNEEEQGASEIYASKYFCALRRVLDRAEPDYAD